jgi:hypothetical protein
MRGTDTGYLMARLQRLDPEVAGKIGKGIRITLILMRKECAAPTPAT